MKEAATSSHRAFALRRNPRDFPALLANSINFANAAGLVDSSASLAAGVELVLQPGPEMLLAFAEVAMPDLARSLCPGPSEAQTAPSFSDPLVGVHMLRLEGRLRSLALFSAVP